MVDLITINVDGRDVQVPKGIQLIEALRQHAAVDTPAFCYHPDLKVAGNCRICLVEIEGPRGFALAISCHAQTAPGMKVRTHLGSEKVVKARKGVMEFLLVNHPLDCPICDKAGECTLQEHYMGQGRHESRLDDAVGKQYKGGADHRFVDTKGEHRGGKRIDLGPTIVLDQERCIICTRCVRFMDDVAHSPQLDIAGRGDHAYLTTFPGKPLDHAYDLCTTDVCPVGALTGKHFRFQQRVWFLKSVESIDPSDAFGANITIDYHNGRVWRLMPRRNPDVNKSWIANSTRMLYQDLARNRLTDGKLAGKDVTVVQALAAAGSALAKAKRIALVASGHLTCEDNATLLALAGKLGGRAEVFGGSWMPVGRPDGIARSGDPVSNRKGLQLLGIPDNLDQLTARAGEFDCLLTMGHDLWGADAAPRGARSRPSRPASRSSAWNDATVAKATIAIGVRCWAEGRGTMVNINGRVQMLHACPVGARSPARAGLAGARPRGRGRAAPAWAWTSEVEAWKHAGTLAPAFAGLTYRAIGPMGHALEAPPAQAAGAAMEPLACMWLTGPGPATYHGYPYDLVAILLPIVIPLIIFQLLPLLVLAERRGAAFIQDRVGPNRAALHNQLKSHHRASSPASREHHPPARVRHPLHHDRPGEAALQGELRPALRLQVASTGWPPPSRWSRACSPPRSSPGSRPILHQSAGGGETLFGTLITSQMGLLLLFAFGSLTVYGIVLGSWSSNSKFSLLGGMRASAMMISYEVSMGLAVLGLLLVTGSFNLTDAVEWQAHRTWGIVVQPVGFARCSWSRCSPSAIAIPST